MTFEKWHFIMVGYESIKKLVMTKSMLGHHINAFRFLLSFMEVPRGEWDGYDYD